MRTLLDHPLPQPLTGIATAILGLAAIALGWAIPHQGVVGLPAPSTIVVALGLGATIVLGHRYPIHLREKTRVYVGTVPLFLMAVLLPPPLALTVVGLSKLTGELCVRSNTGNYPSDIASEAGRWVLIMYAGSLVAHSTVALPAAPGAPLLGAAIVLWSLDILSSPLLLSPLSARGPRQVLQDVIREAGPTEAAHYVVGILGALAAMKALWSLLLLPLPVGLVYLAFRSATDMRESSRRLLASVAEASPEAILVLNLDGTIMLANRQAATLYGFERPEDMVGLDVLETAGHDYQAEIREQIQRVLAGATLKDVEQHLCRRDGGAFVAELSWSLLEDRRGRPEAITTMARDITRRKETEQALQHRALHDALTGLPNRVVLQQRLQEQVERSRDDLPFAVFLLDLNGFKQVNDTHGHHCGDLLLQEVARRLRRTLRDSDTVARLGGDEFAVVLPRADAKGAELVASRVRAVIDEPILVEGRWVGVGASIGIALYPDHGENAEILMLRADSAMYAVKKARNGFDFYRPEHALLGTADDGHLATTAEPVTATSTQ